MNLIVYNNTQLKQYRTSPQQSYFSLERSSRTAIEFNIDVNIDVTIVASWWDVQRWNHAQALCQQLLHPKLPSDSLKNAQQERMSTRPSSCIVERAVSVAKGLDHQDVSNLINQNVMSCVRSAFTWSDALFEPNPWNSFQHEGLDSGLSKSPGAIGCALSHIAAVKEWKHRQLNSQEQQHEQSEQQPISVGTLDAIDFLRNNTYSIKMSDGTLRKKIPIRKSTSTSISQQGQRVLLVLEDDAQPTDVTTFIQQIKSHVESLNRLVGATENAGWDWDILDLLDRRRKNLSFSHRHHHQITAPFLKNSKDFEQVWLAYHMTVAMVYSERGADRILQALPVDHAYDMFLDRLIRQGKIRTFHSLQNLVQHGILARKSQIQKAMKKKSTTKNELLDVCAPFIETSQRVSQVQRSQDVSLFGIGMFVVLAIYGCCMCYYRCSVRAKRT